MKSLLPGVMVLLPKVLYFSYVDSRALCFCVCVSSLVLVLFYENNYDDTVGLTVQEDGKLRDQKANTPRSKHSATEQRRRSKINERQANICCFISGLLSYYMELKDAYSLNLNARLYFC